ncbi:MAG TPA: class I SAM-dependent methyltransferase [Bacteroidia bacterium]|nr:class I SAM-dependent methyltransferase [Bacteroidia bacterium]
MPEEKGSDYIKALQLGKEGAGEYYRKSVVKTEQQKFLEQLIKEKKLSCTKIADVACGGGSLTFHLRTIFPGASFSLCDFNPDALEIAKELNGKECSYSVENIYSLSFPDNTFDLVCCWQTLSWLDDPQTALNELVRIAAPGGTIYVSSLFNIGHDVDIYAKLTDHTRPEGQAGMSYSYNTYSQRSVEKWLDGKVNAWKLHEFTPSVDFSYEGRGLGTFTVNSEHKRLQVSGGYLMNWAILEIEK